MSSSPELQLVEQAKTNPDAFSDLYRKYINKIYSYIAYRVSDQAEAEDLCSHVWEKVLKHLPKFNPNHEASFKAWLYRIAQNTLTDYYRKSSSRKHVPLEKIYSLPDKGSTPSESTKNKMILEQLRHIIDTLPKKQAKVVSLRLFGQFTNKEISTMLNTTEKTVASNYCRALKHINKQLKHV